MKWKGIVFIIILFWAGYGIAQSLSEKESITITGSTTLMPIANAAANEYMREHKDAIISVSGGGSGAGYSSINNDEANIGTHSRKPKEEEVTSANNNNVNLTLYVIGIDALTVIVNPSLIPNGANSITLTRKQIGRIFAKKGITTWGDVESELGVNVADAAMNENVHILDRESGSGTREVFVERCVAKYDYEISADTSGVGSNKEMRQEIKDTKWSIGYIGLGYLISGVSVVKINDTEGVNTGTIYEPTNLKSGGSGKENLTAYPLSRELYMSTNRNILENKPKSLTARFLSFLMSSRGAQIVEKAGFFPLSGKIKVYSWSQVKNFY